MYGNGSVSSVWGTGWVEVYNTFPSDIVRYLIGPVRFPLSEIGAMSAFSLVTAK